MDKIAPYIDQPVIKVITGMRRAGKSYFLLQIIEELKSQGVDEQSIVYINKESLEYDFIKDYQDLHKYIKSKFSKSKTSKKYIFVDEVQEIEDWEKAINSFLVDNDGDIYITGSNAHLLSSELATYISGRYIEFPIYTLSFKEFLQFSTKKEPHENNEDKFLQYMKFGSLPAIHNFEFKEEIIYPYISSIYNTILLKDIIAKHDIRNIKLLEDITHFIFDNIGQTFSAKSISEYLKSQKLRVGVETIQNYLSYLSNTYMINEVSRYDIKGKRILEIYEKYFLGDIGIRHAILGYRESNLSGVLENIVFLELKRRGYKVNIGKYSDMEVDFIASKEKEKLYIQVAYLLNSPEIIQREFNVLQKIKDNYPKYVLSLDKFFGEDFEGIKRINVIDFLLQ